MWRLRRDSEALVLAVREEPKMPPKPVDAGKPAVDPEVWADFMKLYTAKKKQYRRFSRRNNWSARM